MVLTSHFLFVLALMLEFETKTNHTSSRLSLEPANRLCSIGQSSSSGHEKKSPCVEFVVIIQPPERLNRPVKDETSWIIECFTCLKNDRDYSLIMCKIS